MGEPNVMSYKIPKRMRDRRCKHCDKSLENDVNTWGCINRKYCKPCSIEVRKIASKLRSRIKRPKKGLIVCFTCKGKMAYKKSKFCCAKCRQDHYKLTWIQRSIDRKEKYLKVQKIRRQTILDHYRNVQRLVVK